MSERKFNGRSGFVIKIVGGIFGGLILAVLLAFLLGFFVMLLWNFLMPSIFGLPAINYWQAFCIILLAKIVFGPGIHGFDKGRRHERWEKWKDYRKNYEGYDKSKWNVKGGWKNWKYYDDYWTEEGKEAFEKYIDRRESDKNKDSVE